MKKIMPINVLDMLYASAGVATALLTIPQLIKVFITHTHHVNGLSLFTWAGYLTFALIGLIYGIRRKQSAMVVGYGCCSLTYIGVVIGIAHESFKHW